MKQQYAILILKVFEKGKNHLTKLLSFGKDIAVTAPLSLKEKIQQEVMALFEIYKA